MFRVVLAICAVVSVAIPATSLAAQSPNGEHHLWRYCTENAMVVGRNPADVAQVVPSDSELTLVFGRAQVAILVQDCSEYWLDGVDYGPTMDLHALVLLEGPRDVRRVLGAQETMQTMTWFHSFAGTSNPRVREAWERSGRPMDSIDDVAPLRDGLGSATASGTSLSWELTSALSPQRLIGVNHDIYSTDGDGSGILTQVQALAHMASAQGTLAVAGTSPLARLLGPGNHSVLMRTMTPMRARATIRPH